MQKPSPCTKPVKLQWLSFGLREISLRYLSALVSWEGFKHKVACIFPFSHSVVSLITLMLQAMGSLRMSNEMHSNNISLNIYLTTKFPRPQGPASSALWPHWLSVAVIKHRFHIVNKLQCWTASQHGLEKWLMEQQSSSGSMLVWNSRCPFLWSMLVV